MQLTSKYLKTKLYIYILSTIFDPQMMLGFSQQLYIVCNINIEKKEYSTNSEVKNILSNFSLHN